ncbi:NHL repeat-containing protein, partial [Flavobacterium oncorhynchi]|uniref:NHL repeat-containing protein n=1 Tax=Flavobacterium oncorhynchi TaxID=728056 RepID=UPI00351A6CB7
MKKTTFFILHICSMLSNIYAGNMGDNGCSVTVFDAHAVTLPTLSAIANQAVCDGQTIRNIAITLSGDTNAVLSASSSNGSITPRITFSGTDGNRTMDIATTAGQTGAAIITVTATGTNGTTAQTFLLEVGNITSGSVVTTLAGSINGFADGIGAAAKFSYPYAVTMDASGNLLVADYYNHKIRKITPTGVVTTIAGSTKGFADGTGTAAQFYFPTDLAVDASNNIYVVDQSNHKIRKISPTGAVTSFAGSTSGFADGTGSAAKFNYPSGVTVDASGNVYVGDEGNVKIRKITPAGEVTTLAGSTVGFADGPGVTAKFQNPTGLAVDATGNVYVADGGNHKIRKITPAGTVTTLAGSTIGYTDGTSILAKFNNPTDVTLDASDNVYVADYSNYKIRKITPGGAVTTLAGSTAGFADGTGIAAQFNYPSRVTVDVSGTIYVADPFNHLIRKIEENVISYSN